MFRNIMVPLDSSELSESAIGVACDIAVRAKAVLHLTQVNDVFTNVSTSSDPRAHHEALLRKADSLRQVHGIDVEVEVLSRSFDGLVYAGLPGRSVADVLDEEIQRDHVDLVVMTSHGRGGFDRLWIGSVADALLRITRVPVLVLKPPKPSQKRFKAARILVPISMHRDADEELIARCLEIGELYGSSFHLLRVEDPTVTFIPANGPDEIAIRSDHLVDAYLARLAATLAGNGHEVSTSVITTPFVAQGILECALRNNMDMIAISTHRRHMLTRMIVGSVADKITRGAEIPVFAYKSDNDSEGG